MSNRKLQRSLKVGNLADGMRYNLQFISFLKLCYIKDILLQGMHVN
jgi:hypothetical protein